jgi:hypothetical protein
LEAFEHHRVFKKSVKGTRNRAWIRDLAEDIADRIKSMRDDLNVTELTVVLSDEEMIGNHKLFAANFTDATGVCIYSGE